MMDLYEMTMANGYFSDQDKRCKDWHLMCFTAAIRMEAVCYLCRIRADFGVY